MFLDLMMLKPLERYGVTEDGAKQQSQARGDSSVMSASGGSIVMSARAPAASCVVVTTSEQSKKLPSYVPGEILPGHSASLSSDLSWTAPGGGCGHLAPSPQQPQQALFSGVVVPTDMQMRMAPPSRTLLGSGRFPIGPASHSNSFGMPSSTPHPSQSSKFQGVGQALGHLQTCPQNRPRLMTSAHGNTKLQACAFQSGAPRKRMPQICEQFSPPVARGAKAEAWGDDVVVPSEGCQHDRREPSCVSDFDVHDEGDDEDNLCEVEWPFSVTQRRKQYCCF